MIDHVRDAAAQTLAFTQPNFRVLRHPKYGWHRHVIFRSIANRNLTERWFLLCSELNGAVECVNKFAGKCFNERQRQSYTRFTNGAMQMITDFCDKRSSFRKGITAR